MAMVYGSSPVEQPALHILIDFLPPLSNSGRQTLPDKIEMLVFPEEFGLVGRNGVDELELLVFEMFHQVIVIITV